MLYFKAALTGAFALALATTAMAAGTPGQKCAAGKMKAAGKAAAAKASCYAKALGATTAVDTECLTKAQAKLDAAYAKLELAGGCITTTDAPAISAKVDAHVEDVAGDLACSDGLVLGDEQCDDGNEVSGDGCSATCQLECGNGVAEGPEECDDGNGTNGDGCDNNCTTTACGNGIVAGIETCDDGNDTNGDGCDQNCTASACGNGVLAPAEACDDGNIAGTDGCSSTCTLEDTCPCWTTPVLDSLFPVGYFDTNNLGGATCNDNHLYSEFAILSVDTCYYAPFGLFLSRAGLGLSGAQCAYLADEDPANTGTCPSWSQDVVLPVTSSESAACYWTWRKASIVQDLYDTCP